MVTRYPPWVEGARSVRCRLLVRKPLGCYELDRRNRAREAMSLPNAHGKRVCSGARYWLGRLASMEQAPETCVLGLRRVALQAAWWAVAHPRRCVCSSVRKVLETEQCSSLQVFRALNE